MTIADEKRDIRENSDSLEYLLDVNGVYWREEADLIKISERYSHKTQLGKAIHRRKCVAREMRKYINTQIRKKHTKE